MKEKQSTKKKRKSSATVQKRLRNVSIKTKEMSYEQAVEAMLLDADRALLPKFRWWK